MAVWMDAEKNERKEPKMRNGGDRNKGIGEAGCDYNSALSLIEERYDGLKERSGRPTNIRSLAENAKLMDHRVCGA